MRVRFRPTRAEDLAIFNRPVPHRIKAITALLGDRVVGVGGLGYRPDGTVIAFADMTEELRRYPVAVHRAGLEGIKLIRDSGVPMVVAAPQPGEPAAARWLEHFGFKACTVAGRQVFIWRRGVDG